MTAYLNYKKLSNDGEQKICTLQDITKTQLMTSEVNKYIINKHPKYIKAMALISDSSIGSKTGDFYTRIKPPVFPMQMFNNKENAIHWLKQYL